MTINEQCGGSIRSPYQMSDYCVQFIVTTHSSCLQLTVLFNRKLRPLPSGPLLYRAEQAGIVKSLFPPAFP